jgi:hypothetical protein
MSPDVNPYTGYLGEAAYSTVGQPKTYSGRLTNAVWLLANVIQGNQTLLVDEIAPEARNNPVFCTYGPAPVPAFLIRRDGRVMKAQLWLDVNAMETAINNLLNP